MSPRRTALITTGIVFVLLGVGNWITGRGKVSEHEHLLATSTAPARIQYYEEFTELSARTNASLLRPLQARSDERTTITQKLDFYRVVESGGRMLTLLGLFTLAAAMIAAWYRRTIEAPALPPPGLHP